MLNTLLVGVDGVLQGGWEYIWTAWGLTWVSLAAYAVNLIVRGRKG